MLAWEAGPASSLLISSGVSARWSPRARAGIGFVDLLEAGAGGSVGITARRVHREVGGVRAGRVQAAGTG